MLQILPVTAEGAQNVNRQSVGNQQVRIAVLVIVALAVVGVVLWLVLGHSGKHNNRKHFVPYIAPIGYTAKNLAAESKFINTKFYWAGKQDGYLYEFRRTTNGSLYVRYLPPGVPVKAPGAHFLIVATYPFIGAYKALKREAKSNAIVGPNQSIIYVRPKDRKSVLMAFPGVNDQIEIYDPNPAIALNTARSGEIKPVRGS